MTIQEALEIIKDEMPYESGVINEALNMVENAVEKQIPKKLKTIKVGLSGSVLLCPSCENEMAMICDSVWQKGKYKQKYCDNCGQALDWNDLKGETK